jgi:D-alanine-D-alanine ligase
VIDRNGGWFLVSRKEFEEIGHKGVLEKGKKKYTEVVCAPSEGKGMRVLDTTTGNVLARVDVIFPVLHGKYGEDGSIQGMFEMMDTAYVGCGVLASALGMDKEMTKKILESADIETAPFGVLHKGDAHKDSFREYKKMFGVPFFVKPARAGSSVGVRKVCNEREFFSAVREAFLYDDKILVEEMIVGREIECAVLGRTDTPRASALGEVVVGNGHKFYSYTAKYLDDNGAEIVVPTKIAPSIAKRVREIALRAYRVLECEGLTRVDFFVTMRGRVYVNEVNTIPGFTDISMYPKLWEYEGMRGPRLVEELLRLALQSKKQKDLLRTRYEK